MLTAVLFVLSSIITAIGRFLYNSIVGAYYIVRETFISIYTYRIELLILVCLFGVGYPFANKQALTTQAIDVVYECFFFVASQIVGKILEAIEQAFFFVAIRWNDLVLSVRNNAAIGIQNIINVSGNTVDKVVKIIEAIIGIFLGIIDGIPDIPSFIIPYATDIFSILIHAFVRLVQALETQIEKIVFLEWFSEDCTFCDIYTNDYRPDFRCRFMETSSSQFGVNCLECDTFVNDIIFIIADIINGILEVCGLQRSIIVDELADSFICIFNLGKRPVFIIFAFIDDSIHDGNCIDTEQFFKELLNWGLDILECADALFQTITQGKVTSFFEFIFSVVLKFFYDIINGVRLIIACFSNEDQADCLALYPRNCAYSSVTKHANAGLQTCARLAAVCLGDIPFLVNLTDIGPSHFNLFSIGPAITIFIDDIVCFFQITIDCVEHPPGTGVGASGTEKAEAVLSCMGDRIPGIRSFTQAIVDIIDFFNTIARGVTQTFECFGGDCVKEGFSGDFLGTGDSCSILQAISCIPQCFKDPNSCDASRTGNKRSSMESLVMPRSLIHGHQMANDVWVSELQKMDVNNNTYCGRLLLSKSPAWLVNQSIFDHGEYTSYKSCLAMLVINHVGNGYVGSFMFPILISHIRPDDLKLANPNYESRSTRKYSEISENPSRVRMYFDSLLDVGFTNKTGDTPSIPSYLMNEAWKRFTQSGYYQISYDFIDKMNSLTVQMHGNSSYSYDDFRKSSSHVYLEYARSLLSHHANVMNERKRSMENRVVYTKYRVNGFRSTLLPQNDLITLSDLEAKAKITSDIFSTLQDSATRLSDRYPALTRLRSTYEKHFPAVKKAYDIIMESDIRYWPSIQQAHGLYYVITNATYEEAHQYINKEKVYHIDEGLVTPDEFDYHMKRSNFEHIESDLTYKYNYDLRNIVRKYTFLLIDFNHTKVFPSISEIATLLVENEALRLNNTRTRLKAKLESSNNSNLNQWFIDFADWFIGIFSADKAFLNTFYANLKETFAPENLRSFFTTTFTSWFIDVITCTVPYNFNGTEIYSPICFPLIPEYIFEWAQMVPTDDFPVQIQWPEEFITKNCTNIFNTRKNIFEVNLNNNCYADAKEKTPQTDGQIRKLCPNCDYCERDYDVGCSDLGFIDFADSLLFILGSIPNILNGFYNNGFTPKEVELPAFWLSMLAATVTRGPYLALQFTIITILLLWIISNTFGIVTYGVIVTLVTIMTVILVPQALTTFPFIYLAIGLVIVSWLISVWVPFSFGWLKPLFWFKSLLEFANHNILFWAPNLDFLLARISRFDYTGTSIPHVDVFCFFWTFQNIVLGIIVAFFFYFYIRLWSVINTNIVFFVYDIAQIIYYTIKNKRSEANEKQVFEVTSRVKKFKGLFDYLKTKTSKSASLFIDKWKKWKNKTKKRVVIKEDPEIRIISKNTNTKKSASLFGSDESSGSEGEEEKQTATEIGSVVKRTKSRVSPNDTM
jgi:hypothetical protein